jgi:hypothetical protein
MIWTKKDKLIGNWSSGAAAESAYHDMFQGFNLEFKADGTGIRQDWEGGSEETKTVNFQPERPFSWQRMDENQIKIKLDITEEWDEMDYDITEFYGAYDILYDKIVIKGTETFWECVEPIYRAKVKPVSLSQKVSMIILILVVVITLIIMLKD